jgi:uncharacterized protein YndB with AHSA1/START domain
MHGPDGHDFPNEIRFIEVVKPERLVYAHGGENDVSFHVTVTFERQGEKTKLTMVTLFPTAEMLDFVAREYGAIEGGKQHLDRLGEYLQQVFITRTFDAPRELVFRAWTDAAQLEQWYAPSGCSVRFTKLDLREGGEFHSCVRTPDGHDCWCKGVYREIVAPERIVYTLAVADEHGNLITPVQAGMDPEWPRETTVTVTFAEHDGKTTLTLHQTVSASLAQRTGALPSWLSMFDRLESSLQRSH